MPFSTGCQNRHPFTEWPVMALPFDVDERGVRATRDLESGEVFTFSAEAIRTERTGVHARLSILQDGGLLALAPFRRFVLVRMVLLSRIGSVH